MFLLLNLCVVSTYKVNTGYPLVGAPLYIIFSSFLYSVPAHFIAHSPSLFASEGALNALGRGTDADAFPGAGVKQHENSVTTSAKTF